MNALHPAFFRAPAADRNLLSPSQFRAEVALLQPILRGLSETKLKVHRFDGIFKTEYAPNTMEELREAVTTRRRHDNLFPIFDSDGPYTLLARTRSQSLYRAWHDLVHLEVDGAFTLPGEIGVINAQLEEMQRCGCDIYDCSIVWYDIMGQLLHELKHGVFPERPIEFLEACLCKGKDFALAYKW